MLSQQHTGQGHSGTEGPGPSSDFMLTEEYFLALAGVQKCWDAWKAWAKLEELP